MDVFTLVASIVLNTKDYEDALKKSGEDTNAFANKLKSGLATAGKVAAAGMAAATAAVTAFAGSSIKAGAEFDSSMSQVAATMGTTVDKIQGLRDYAMEMGAKTAFSATQAADALNYMALAGYDADESMQALPNVLNLAAAGGIDLAYASDMVTDAQSALGLSMDESAALVDKMAMAASKSNTSVAQLGEAILTVGGTAKNLAGGTTELSTALGILADNGIKGAEGGTALRNIILSLSAPTDTASGLMEHLGLEVFDAAGNMRPLNETFEDLNKILSTMTQEEKTNVLNSIFNKVDLKSAEALLANTGYRFDELSGYIDNATGSAENMAATQLDNFAGDVTLLKSAVEGVQIAFSDKLSPALRQGTQFLTELAGSVQQFIEDGGIEQIIQLFTDLAPVISGVTAAVVAYKAAMAISSIVDAATKTVKAYQAANEGATVAQALLNTTILKNPFALIVSLIASVVTALVTLYMTNEDFRNKVNAAWQSVKDTISGVVNAVVTFFTKTVPTAGREMLDFFKSIPDMALQWGKDLIDNFVNGIKSKVEDVKNAVSNVASTVKDFLGFSEPEKGPLSNFHTYAPDMMQLFASGIRGNAGLLKSAFDDSLDFGTKNVDFGTANVDFASSAVGQSSAAIINSVSGRENGMPIIPLTINLQTGDGKNFASWILNDLIAVAKANGTPIAGQRYA